MTNADIRDNPQSTGSTLKGNLGVADLVFTALAYNAPLAIAAGFIPVVVGYGNHTGAPSTFIVIGVLLAVFAIGLVAMARFMKSPGAFYSYIAAGLGRIFGLGGAFIAFAGYMAIAMGSAAYGGIAVQALVSDLLNGPHVPWGIWSLIIWASASALSLLNVNVSAKVLGIAMVFEVVLVLLWDSMVFIKGGPEGIPTEAFTYEAFTSGSFAFAMLFGVLCITGFETVAVFREETKDPVKTVPRATYTIVAVLASLYALTSLSYLTALGPEKAVEAGTTDPVGSFIGSVQSYVGTVAADLVTVLLVSSVFAAVLATQNISARYLYTLGEDGVLPAKLGVSHPRHGSPFNASLTVAVIVLVGFMLPAVMGLSPARAYTMLTGFGGVCLLTLMTFTSIAVIAFFHRTSEHEANIVQSLIAPVLSFLGLASILYLAAKNMEAILGTGETGGTVGLLVIVAILATGAGTAMYYRAARPEVFARIGKQDI